jgi:uncharacterized protein (TIGR03084 family)
VTSASPPSPEVVLSDLAVEHSELDDLVSHMEAESWDAPTPAEGWSVRDQISHLAFFDDAATRALCDPEGFTVMARSALEKGGDPMEEHLSRGREMMPEALLEWWRSSRSAMVESARAKPGGSRVQWFGPPMGLTSFVSARLMETWAHGQDVADALGVERVASDRLRHVAHLGVRARSFSYVVRGMDPPSGTVRVELEAPSGGLWVWEDDDTAGCGEGLVKGSAVDFCLVVTQRRHLDDTSLETTGAVAEEWMAIAQCFAGPPGPGRSPVVRSGADPMRPEASGS